MTSPLPTDEDARGLDLDALERIAKAATPGPWSSSSGLTEWGNYVSTFSPSTVLSLIAAARRSVVSTPSDEVGAIYHPALIEGQERFGGDTARAGAFAVGAVWALEASAVSAPPTIPDEAAVDRAARSLAGLSERLWEQAKTEAAGGTDYYVDQARAALRVALGGEA